jgi:hypothetical protein
LPPGFLPPGNFGETRKPWVRPKSARSLYHPKP